MRVHAMRSGLGLLVLLATACIGPGVTTDVSSLRFPVLVGPVERIGAEPGSSDRGRFIASVEAEASHSYVSGQTGSEVQGDHVVNTYESLDTCEDNMSCELSREAGANPNRVVYLDSVTAAALNHAFCFAYNCQYVAIEGQVFQKEGRTDVASLRNR
ncbi:MAG: hypothetical protein AB1486_17250 [Planctomycetota bacterium]